MSNATRGSINFSETATGFSNGTIEMFSTPGQSLDSNHQITSTNTEITFESTEPSQAKKSALKSFFDVPANISKQYTIMPQTLDFNTPIPMIMVISKKKADGTQSFSTAYPNNTEIITYLNNLGADYFIMFKWEPPPDPTSGLATPVPNYKYFKSSVGTIIPVEEAIVSAIPIGNQNKTETEEARKALDSIKKYMKSIISDNYVKNLTPKQLKKDLSFIKEFKEWENGADYYISNPINPGDFIWEENDDETVNWYINETGDKIKTLDSDNDEYVEVNGTKKKITRISNNIRELDSIRSDSVNGENERTLLTNFILSKIAPQYAAIDKLITSTTTSTSAPVSDTKDDQHKRDLLDIYQALSGLTKPN
tara:strand:- start:53 stop:1150 length:1098 start_codon:yes stop_codon:yes gene_type:complete